MDLPEQVKLAGDGLAIVGWVSALTELLTHGFGLAAAICSFLWCAIRLYETNTVQDWLKRHK